MMVQCLLIDTDVDERKRLSRMLGDMGFTLTESAMRDDGLKYCNDNFPEVVVMAADAQGMAAGDFLRRVRRSATGKKPVVIVYAHDPDAEEINQSILDGAADVLMQPFDRDLLKFKLQLAGIL